MIKFLEDFTEEEKKAVNYKNNLYTFRLYDVWGGGSVDEEDADFTVNDYWIIGWNIYISDDCTSAEILHFLRTEKELARGMVVNSHAPLLPELNEGEEEYMEVDLSDEFVINIDMYVKRDADGQYIPCGESEAENVKPFADFLWEYDAKDFE